MTTIALDRRNGNQAFWTLLLVATLFFSILVGGSALLASRQVAEVPLRPCKQCTSGCPCPRLSGAVRCGCPQ